VEVVCDLVGTDGIHVCVDPHTRYNMMSPEGISFPFGQRLDNFNILSSQCFQWKAHGQFGPAQVVVQAGAAFNQQRGCNSPEFQFTGQFSLKGFLDEFYGLLCLPDIQDGFVG